MTQRLVEIFDSKIQCTLWLLFRLFRLNMNKFEFSKFFKNTVISGCIDPIDVRKDNFELQGGDIINKGDEQ